MGRRVRRGGVGGAVIWAAVCAVAWAGGGGAGLVHRGTVSTPAGPKSLCFSPSGRTVLVNCLYGHRVALFDPATRKMTAAIRVPDEPVEAAWIDDERAWVSLYNTKHIVLVDTVKKAVVKSVAVGNIPKVVACSPDGLGLYVSNWASESVSVVSAAAGRTVKTLRGFTVPRGICFTRGGNFAYVANMGGDSVTKIDVARGHRTVRQIAVGRGPRHIVADPDGRFIYVSVNYAYTIAKVRLADDTVAAWCTVGRAPRTICLSPDGRLLYVCNYDDGTLSVVDTRTMTERGRVATHYHPIGVAAGPDGRSVWVSNYRGSIIDIYERTP